MTFLHRTFKKNNKGLLSKLYCDLSVPSSLFPMPSKKRENNEIFEIIYKEYSIFIYNIKQSLMQTCLFPWVALWMKSVQNLIGKLQPDDFSGNCVIINLYPSCVSKKINAHWPTQWPEHSTIHWLLKSRLYWWAKEEEVGPAEAHWDVWSVSTGVADEGHDWRNKHSNYRRGAQTAQLSVWWINSICRPLLLIRLFSLVRLNLCVKG